METAGRIFDLSPEAVRGMIKRREIPFAKMGRRVRIAYADLQAQLVRYPSKVEVLLDYAGDEF